MRKLLAATAATACLTALSLTASADKFAYHSTGKPTVELSERVKPRAAHTDAPAAPTFTADTLLGVQVQLTNVRVEEIGVLQKLIAETPDSDPDKPDLLFRLAEIHAKQYRTAHLLAVQASMSKHGDVDKVHAKEAADALANAIRVYAQLASAKFANYPKADAALFYFAFTLQTADRATEAREVYDRMLKNYPGSQFAPEAHLAFADYYFQQGQLTDAEDRYKKVLKFPKSSLYWYADYMLGWVQLNQKNAQGALETFYAVAQGTKSLADQAQLRKAALHDFVRAYAEVGKSDQALHAFTRVDGAASHDMLEQLAEFYIDQGKADRAIFVLRQLMHDLPRSERVCQWEQNVAREMFLAGSRSDEVHEIQQLVTLYGALAKAKTLPAGELSDCRDAASEMSGEYARAFHQEAAKTMNVELLASADALYGSYLAAFPDAKDFADTQYFRAELAWMRAEMTKDARAQTQRWEDAAAAFTAVVSTGKLDAKLTKESADAAMQAWMRALAVDPRQHAEPTPKEVEDRYKVVPKPRALPEREQKLLAAYDLYIQHVTDPHDDELVDVKFLRAKLLYRYDHLTEAIAGFEDILAHHRDHETAEFAANLALDGYNVLQRYDDMFALATRLEKDSEFLKGKDELVGVLKSLRRQGLAKQADQLAKIGHDTHDNAKLVACGDAYVALYNSDTLASDGDTILFAAAQCYEGGKSLGLALSLYEKLGQLFPQSKLTAHSLEHLGDIYADVAFYKQAATKLEDYAKKYAGEGDAFTALSNAVAYRKGIGDDPQAIADTELFIRMFGKQHPAEAAAAAWSLTAIYEKLGDTDKLAQHLRRYIDGYAKTGGADRLVMAYTKLGDAEWRASCPVATVDGTCAHVSRETATRLATRHAATRAQTTCGEADKVLVTVVGRDATRVRLAMAAYAAAVAEFDKHDGKVGGDERGALFHYASAKFGLAERDFEAYVASQIPTGLDFDPRKPQVAAASSKRFDTWMKQKGDLGGVARAQYEAILNLHDGATAIAAAARLGQISQSAAGQLYRAEIPRNLREDDELAQSYCDALAERAAPLEKSALHSYDVCVKQSTRLGWFSEWSRVCERELGQLDPQDYPTTAEIRRSPDIVSQIEDVEPPARL
jgi:tetratricopeptide (TPR) repeat protein|nr:tetratricopeptide repeat protein [Kofleriaceae bacterium]